MNYLSVYKSIILKAQNEYSNRLDQYTESHHIVPKCMGGSNHKSNLVHLTPREHFICHWLLWKAYRVPELAYAFRMMSVAGTNKQREKGLNSFRITSHAFQAMRIAQYEANTKRTFNKKEVKTITSLKNIDELPNPETYTSSQFHHKFDVGSRFIINTETKEKKTIRVDEEIPAGWKLLLTDTRKLVSKLDGSGIMVAIDSPLLVDLDFDQYIFSTFESKTMRCYIVKNKASIRYWSFSNKSDFNNDEWELVSERIVNVDTKEQKNVWIRDLSNYDIGNQWVIWGLEKQIAYNIKTKKSKWLYPNDNRVLSGEYVLSDDFPRKYYDVDLQQYVEMTPNQVKQSSHTILKNKPIIKSTNKTPRKQKRKLAYISNKTHYIIWTKDGSNLDKNEWSLFDEVNNCNPKLIRKSCRILKNIKTGESALIHPKDPRYNHKDWQSAKKGKINLRNQNTGEIRCVTLEERDLMDLNDWKPLGYNKCAYKNKTTGEIIYCTKDDPRIQSDDWQYNSKGWSTFVNVKTGEKASFGKDDSRYWDDDWQSIYKDINNNQPDITCPYCGTICHKGKGYTRWHGEKCKKNPNNVGFFESIIKEEER